MGIDQGGADITVAQQFLDGPECLVAGLGSAPADEKAESIRTGLYRLQAIVQIRNPLSHLIEQAPDDLVEEVRAREAAMLD